MGKGLESNEMFLRGCQITHLYRIGKKACLRLR
jgi:hypothetical protein